MGRRGVGLQIGAGETSVVKVIARSPTTWQSKFHTDKSTELANAGLELARLSSLHVERAGGAVADSGGLRELKADCHVVGLLAMTVAWGAGVVRDPAPGLSAGGRDALRGSAQPTRWATIRP